MFRTCFTTIGFFLNFFNTICVIFVLFQTLQRLACEKWRQIGILEVDWLLANGREVKSIDVSQFNDRWTRHASAIREA